MRVLLVNDYPVTGGYGAEAYVRRLAAGLRQAGDEVAVWAGEVRHQGAGRWRDVWDPAARAMLRGRIASFRPDVVHFHNVIRECSPSVLAASDSRSVMTVHDHRILGVPDRQGSGVAGRVMRLAVEGTAGLAAATARRRLSATMAVSEPIASELRRRGFPDVTVIAVPIDPPVREPGPAAGNRDLAFVGRLSPDKGPDLAIAAFARVADKFPRAQLRVVGEGPARAALTRQAAPLGERVHFLGRLEPDQVSDVLATSRAVVVPSVPDRRPEGSPTVVAEAAAHGRPLIASDDAGLAAAARRLGGAVIVPAGDVAALAEAMVTVLSDDRLVDQLGARARAAVFRTHGLTAVTAAVRAVYQRALGTG